MSPFPRASQSPFPWGRVRGGGATYPASAGHPPPTPPSGEGSLCIAGYAALFGLPDGAHDTIVPGAFRRTLAQRRSPVPLHWQHRPDQRIGWAAHISEDARGLRVIATLDNPQGRAAHMVRRRAVSGLSFGYRARGFHRAAQGRVLTDIDLFEVSLVTHPLQPGARVHLVV